MIKRLVGLIKGAIIGGAVGYGAYALGNATGFANPWLTYGVVGVLVGLLVGRPIWSLIRDQNATTVVSMLKAAFGFGVGCGLYALVSKAINPTLTIAGQDVFSWPVTLGGAIGAVYGGFVELDDAIGDGGAKKLPAKTADKSGPAKHK